MQTQRHTINSLKNHVIYVKPKQGCLQQLLQLPDWHEPCLPRSNKERHVICTQHRQQQQQQHSCTGVRSVYA
jgi:hypothetical protein